MLITPEYSRLNMELHQSRADYGTSGARWSKVVELLARQCDAATVLDYGCGKQTLAAELRHLKIVGYDPAIPGLDNSPEAADLVICTDVLEHVEPECIDAVLDDICRVTSKIALVTVATRPAVKVLSDGRNAHLTVKPYAWWKSSFLSRFDIVEVAEIEGFEFCLLLKALHTDLDLPANLLAQMLVNDVKLDASVDNPKPPRNSSRMEIEHLGKKLTFITPNEMTQWRVSSFYSKEPDTVRWLESMPDGSIFLDVGANVGMYSIFASKVKNARVYAFEPESQNFSLLNQNIQANALSGRVMAYPLAISDDAKIGPLYLSSFSQGGSCHSFDERVGFDLKPREEAFIQGSFSVTIDRLVLSGSMPCPEFVKIDVDGFEHKVLRGARNTLLNPILKEILIELNTNLPEHQSVIEDLRLLGFVHDPAQAESALRQSGAFKGVGEFIFRRSGAPRALDFNRRFSISPPRTRDEWRVLQHVQKRIANAMLETEPFPYIVVDNVFPDEYYERMLSHFPSSKCMRPLYETGRVGPGAYEERYAVLFDEADFSRLEPETGEFWRSLAQWMYSDPFANTFVTRFADALYPRLDRILQSAGKLEVKGDALLVEDHTKYAIGPHTDAPHRLVTFLFYLPSDDSMKELGTSIYRPKDPTFTCWGGPHHSFDRFEKVKTVEYLPNRLLAFPKTERSFHGVEPIKREHVERRLLINNVKLLNDVKH